MPAIVLAAIPSLQMIQLSKNTVFALHIVMNVFNQNRFGAFHRCFSCSTIFKFGLLKAVFTQAILGRFFQKLTGFLTEGDRVTLAINDIPYPTCESAITPGAVAFNRLSQIFRSFCGIHYHSFHRCIKSGKYFLRESAITF